MPGVLPVLNRTVVDYALRMALATGCTIARESRFARKNYFYPDLPKGYQISQYELPIAEHGEVEIEVDGTRQRIRIRRIHMEEDAGKLNHDPHRPVSMVDLNRTGVPLIEIVSEPDIGSAEAAGAYLRQLRAIVRYLGICDGNLEEGSFRCDANVSIRPRGATAFGTRAELKNLNSFRFVEKAIDYEISRQMEVLSTAAAVVQETRLWDADRNQTVSMRGKEDAHDYRYFPDPDLLPLVIDEDWIEPVRAQLPELPEPAKRVSSRVRTAGLRCRHPDLDRELADYFEDCLKMFAHPKPVSNWIMGALLGLLNAQGITIEQSPIPAAALAALLQLVETAPSAPRSPRPCSTRWPPPANPPSHRRRKGAGPGQRHRRHRAGHRRRPGRQPRRGRGLQGRQDQADGLFRRPGHEGHPRPGQSEDRERDSQAEAWA